jgi:hypothetical protein
MGRVDRETLPVQEHAIQRRGSIQTGSDERPPEIRQTNRSVLCARSFNKKVLVILS